MKLSNILFALAVTFPLAAPVGATMEEPMVVLPALKFLGASRLSTIQHCAEITKVTDWAILSTDSELEGMRLCLEEHT